MKLKNKQVWRMSSGTWEEKLLCGVVDRSRVNEWAFWVQPSPDEDHWQMCEEHRPPFHSAIFCWETPDPGIHVDTTWHKPAAWTPLQKNLASHDTSNPHWQWSHKQDN